MADLTERAHHLVENQNKVRRMQILATSLVVDDDESLYGLNRAEKDELITELERLFQTCAIGLGEEIPKPE